MQIDVIVKLIDELEIFEFGSIYRKLLKASTHHSGYYLSNQEVETLIEFTDPPNSKSTLSDELAEANLSAEKAETTLKNLVHIIQRFQPAGSPPPGDESVLAEWVLNSMQARLDAAELFLIVLANW